MKKIIFALCFAATAAVRADDSAANNNSLPDEKSRVSYAIGMSMGHTLLRQGVEVDPALVSRGIQDVLSSNATLLTPEQVQQTLTTFQQEFRVKQQQKLAEEGTKNIADGEAFLAANKSKPGVVTLPDGLQYEVLTNGSGPMPTASDTVTVNYRGTLIDGTEFDSSYKRGQPATFPVGGVISGWTEALQKMPVGSKWKLFIPSHLAYGERGMPPTIAPNSVLIFDVELMSIKPAQPPRVAPSAQPLTSDIIAVPGAEDRKKGMQPYTIKASEAAALQQTNK